MWTLGYRKVATKAKGDLVMGYISMQRNDTVIQYGNRVQSVQPLIKASAPVEPVKLTRTDRHRKEKRDKHEKGYHFDAQA
ncbi:hypothetical protein SAMN04488123_10346 [Natribacillus halophilus]|uniref:Uncharacterized protein n=2 Tax=Natribacillus halophilus TaxID=549003 RepID=A0A1G8LES2_9BACI|nr:hypothetical protein SAMN04488123_10346 [Natribacillus halophilus]